MSRKTKNEAMVQSALGRTIEGIENMAKFVQATDLVLSNTKLNLNAEQRVEFLERIVGAQAQVIATLAATLVELDGKLEQLKDAHNELHSIVLPLEHPVPPTSPVDISDDDQLA